MTRMLRFHAAAVLLVVSAAMGSAAGQSTLRKPDVVFVPTDPAVVKVMLQMAGVSKRDLVYDLGCGDGRLVITAAKEYGARGVGIDIDPERIKESKENAAKAGVTDKVKFILGDLFAADFHEATVVTLYLLPELNLKLRPILMKQLKPGTPVVSHDFDMGDWKPDEQRQVEGATRTHTVYKWIIPAKVAGVWQFNGGGKTGAQTGKLSLQQNFQEVIATLQWGEQSTQLKDVKLEGDTLMFTRTDTGERFIGLLQGGVIKGSAAQADGKQIGAWTAARLQTTAANQ